jgi:hypothetical protein
LREVERQTNVADPALTPKYDGGYTTAGFAESSIGIAPGVNCALVLGFFSSMPGRISTLACCISCVVSLVLGPSKGSLGSKTLDGVSRHMLFEFIRLEKKNVDESFSLFLSARWFVSDLAASERVI